MPIPDDPDDTLTQPLWTAAPAAAPLLGVTVLWHPEWTRVGEQFVGLGGAGELELSRYAPVFSRPGAPGLPLGHRGVTREPLTLRRDRAGNVTLVPPPSARMLIELNGAPLAGPRVLAEADIGAGVVLCLGGAVLLCLHWMPALPRAGGVPGMLGVGGCALRVRAQIAQAAATDLPVLLLGETGSGKEVAARAIHAASARRGGPLVAVNMATLQETLAAAELFGASKGAYTGAQQARGGLFGAAAGGTLFLDEIGATPAAVQPMLLRVLESGEYRAVGSAQAQRSSARLVAATDLRLDAEEGAGFSQPLLRRLEGYVLHMPPLRRRREDIGLLVAHFAAARLERHGVAGLPLQAVGAWCLADWPGNVRQLENVVRRALLALDAGEALPPELLPAPRGPGAAPESTPQSTREPVAESAPASAAAPSRTVLEEVSEQAVLEAMRRGGWQIRAAAQALGVSRPSMYKLLARHPQIRPAHAIPRAELEQALLRNGQDLARCAAELQTPGEPLRRHLRAQGLAARGRG
ncbi:sigma-54-dependent transcriptional regulator [Pseudoduganella namucuonensis]|uniref:Two-component system, NtrC family, nitrogen regulation response regulator GlnG n=1 Tax=Pseudoduganella namucuonensis TaxID=1035707 RepID=A0A1I7F0F5_9BURK|nr:sigma 54-interacting transcriptional regulator [Pseudoduganella namucuonensis]SFU29614.1 two-component system, NtrC family, nitrogen regulation response regulator GlnG [Pseudoduganella namucuonensis]